MPAPFEIIAAPFTLWWAPVGTTFPAIDATPAVAWTKVGTSGDENYNEDGVTVSHAQEISQARPLGSTGAVKAFRTSEEMSIGITMWDLSLEQYALSLNGNGVTATAAGVGTAGTKSLALYRGEQVSTMALLVRGDVSPYGDGFAMQYEVPNCFQNGSPQVVYRKGDPAGIALEFMALVDPSAATEAERFGRLITQTAAALP